MKRFIENIDSGSNDVPKGKITLPNQEGERSCSWTELTTWLGDDDLVEALRRMRRSAPTRYSGAGISFSKAAGGKSPTMYFTARRDMFETKTCDNESGGSVAGRVYIGLRTPPATLPGGCRNHTPINLPEG